MPSFDYSVRECELSVELVQPVTAEGLRMKQSKQSSRSPTIGRGNVLQSVKSESDQIKTQVLMALAHSVSELTISSEVNPPPRTACSRDSEKLTSDPKLGTISPSLLRLFKSSVFTMDLALQYMFKEENPFVKVYLAHRLYGFDPVDVDFYLPQLVSLYQHSSELAEGLHPYFISRCIQSTEFAIHLVWLLDTLDPLQRNSAKSTILSRPSSLPISSVNPSSVNTPTFTSNEPISDYVSEQKAVADTHDFSIKRLRGILLPLSGCTSPSANPSCHFLSKSSSFTSGSAIYCSSSTALNLRCHPTPCASGPSSITVLPTPTNCQISANDASCSTEKRAVSCVAGPTACRRSQSLPLWSTFDANYADCASSTAEIGATNPVFSRSTPEWLDLRDCALGAQQPILSDSAIGSFPHRTDSSVDLSCCLELYTNPSSSSVLNASSDDVASSLAHKKFSGVSQTTFLGTPSGDVNFSSPDTELRQTYASYQSNSVETVPSHLPVVRNDMPSADSLARLQSRLIPRLSPEWDFIGSLLRLARRLMPLTSKGQRTAYLQAELANLNLHLPARVWIPVNKADHIILRIPPTAAVCLNSKNKAPYLIYLEVLSCVDPWTEPLPSKPIINTSGQSMNSSTPTGATSFTSLSGCPWNSNTPSSTSESGLHPLDAMSLSSDDSVNILKGSIGCLERPLAFESLLPLPNGEITSAASTTADLSSPPNPPVYISASQIRSRLKDQSERHPNYSFISDPEDPSAAVLKEPWRMKCQRIRELSPWGSLPGWRLNAAIIKVGDDLRQEQLAYQLLSVLQRIWQAEYIPLWLRPLKVIVTSPDSGLIEPVPDTVSFHQIRRHARLSLLDYLLKEHGPPNSEAFLTAQRNFVHSCAAYSVVGYLLQVKDRHNSNILLDREGHVIHIDYGFILSASPGKNIGFEASPFKLTAEQVAVMGGVGSDMFEYFKCLLLRGLLAARKHMERICVLVEIARATCPQLPCFARGGGSAAISGLRQRFQMSRTEEQLRQSTEHMVEASLHSITTKLYDSFQYYTNGIQ